jgi:phage terminase Nu1 subunit (DNA packaging protein)
MKRYVNRREVGTGAEQGRNGDKKTRKQRKNRQKKLGSGERLFGVAGGKPQNLASFGKKIMEVAVSVLKPERGEGMMTKTENDSAKVTNIDSITVSAAVLGDMFGVTDRRVRQMAEEGIVARAAKGRYKLVESVKNYLLTLKLAAEGIGVEMADGEINFDEEKAIHERVKRHISELKLQIMKGELHKAEDVETVMMDMLAAFKTRMMNIPSKVAPILESRDAAYIEERLTSEVTEALNELKDYDPKVFYSDEYVESEEEYEQPQS